MKLSAQVAKFHQKIIREAGSDGYYRVTDSNEIIFPYDGLIIRIGKRRVVRLKIKRNRDV